MNAPGPPSAAPPRPGDAPRPGLGSLPNIPSWILDSPLWPWSAADRADGLRATGQAPDYHDHLAAHTARTAPGRFLWFTGLTALVTLLLSLREGWQQTVVPLWSALRTWSAPRFNWGELLSLLPSFATAGLYGTVFFFAYRAALQTRDHIAAAQQVLLYGTLMAMGMYAGVAYLQVIDNPLPPLVFVFLPSVLAALCLPITDAQVRWPMVPLLLINAGLMLVPLFPGELGPRTVGAAVSVFIPIPAIALAWFKHSRRTATVKLQFFEASYGDIRRELVDARRLHEALFPEPQTRHGLRFAYSYEPMRQIGGDYLFARFTDPPGPGAPALNLLLTDVTGHGISAALTVNRLYGEIERLYAEAPDAQPAQVLAGLNRYVYLTLANHALFCSAVCIRIDPVAGRVQYASAGHPPAFIRRRAGPDSPGAPDHEGGVAQLDSTAPVLGVLEPEEFPIEQVEIDLAPGDRLVAYTDGAIEAVDAGKTMFGLPRLRAIIARAAADGKGAAHHDDLASRLLAEVRAFRDGAPRDDTLVVEVVRLPAPLDPAPGPESTKRPIASKEHR